MSGPVSTVDAPAARAESGHPTAPCVDASDSREAAVGRFRVRRALPRRGRRTVGAWCYADHMGPADVTENSGLDIGPPCTPPPRCRCAPTSSTPNVVARSRDEIDAAHASWEAQDGRFGRVRSSLPRVPVAAPRRQRNAR